jgi:hypothetical protein
MAGTADSTVGGAFGALCLDLWENTVHNFCFGVIIPALDSKRRGELGCNLAHIAPTLTQTLASFASSSTKLRLRRGCGGV